MSEAKKDLAYYLAHTDEMPTDPKLIEALANDHMQAAMEAGAGELTVDRFVQPEEKPAAEKPKDEPKADVAKEEKSEAKADEKPKEEAKEEKPEPKPEDKPKPDGVLAKDGKNLIPFSVLESTRERAASAEERAAAADALVAAKEKEIERLKSEASGEKPAVNAPKTQQLTEEEFAALEADSPTLTTILRAQQQTIQQLTTEVRSLKQAREQEEKDEKADTRQEMRAAIDANPTLLAWEAEQGEAWTTAAKFDKFLREDPKYAEVPFEDRFAKVVELTQTELGLKVEKPAPKDEPKLTPEEVKAAAAEKLKGKPSLPRSLSDIPGGAPPAVDEKQKVEGMSATALGQQFLGMTREQMDAYLSSL